MPKPTTIEDYIAAAAPEAQPQLRELWTVLSEIAPDASQDIKWSQPTFTQGRILFAFKAYKASIAFFPTPAIITAFKDRLSAIDTTAASVKFPIGEPMPVELIRDMAAQRLHDVIENDAKWM